MEKAITVEFNKLDKLNDYLSEGWTVKKMKPFFGNSHGQYAGHTTEPMLVILKK